MVSTEEEWCDYGDMLKVCCEHCQTGEKNAGTNRGNLGVTGATGFRGPTMLATGAAVPAVFNGVCAAKICTLDGYIHKDEDEWIVRIEAGWAHEECAP